MVIRLMIIALKPRKENSKVKSESEEITLKSVEIFLTRRVTCLPVIGVRRISENKKRRFLHCFFLLNSGLLYKMVTSSLHYLHSYLHGYIFILYSVPNYVY